MTQRIEFPEDDPKLIKKLICYLYSLDDDDVTLLNDAGPRKDNLASDLHAYVGMYLKASDAMRPTSGRWIMSLAAVDGESAVEAQEQLCTGLRTAGRFGKCSFQCLFSSMQGQHQGSDSKPILISHTTCGRGLCSLLRGSSLAEFKSISTQSIKLRKAVGHEHNMIQG